MRIPRTARSGVRSGRTPAQLRRMAQRRRTTRRPTKALVRTVKRIVSKQAETKYVANQYDGGLAALANQWYSTGSLAAVGSWFPALPALGEGTGDYQRVGDKIRPTSVKVSLKVFFDPQNIDANSIYGVIYYGTSKSVKSWNAASPVGNAQILDQGDGTNTTFDASSLWKLNLPVDKKGYNIKRIMFRMAKTPGIQNNDLSGNTVTGGNYSTANGLECKNFLLTIPHPKTIIYNDNVDVWPANYAPFYAVGFCHADGSPLTVADQKLVKVSSHCHMYFKDM